MNLTFLLAAAAFIPSSPSLGVAAGRCRANEAGPAILVDVAGLRDRQGLLKLEVYPSNDGDFLGDDNVLVMGGRSFVVLKCRFRNKAAYSFAYGCHGPVPTVCRYSTIEIRITGSMSPAMALALRLIRRWGGPGPVPPRRA